MADTPSETPPADPPAPADPPPADPPPAEPSGTDWKGEARKWESRAKENAAAAKRLQEIEDAQKSETEKLLARAEAAEKRAADLEAARLRDRVAQANGIPADLVDRLVGATEEELAADAQRLAALLRPSETPPPPPPPPADGGPRGTPAPAQLTRADLQGMTPAEVEKARAEGRLADVLSGKK